MDSFENKQTVAFTPEQMDLIRDSRKVFLEKPEQSQREAYKALKKLEKDFEDRGINIDEYGLWHSMIGSSKYKEVVMPLDTDEHDIEHFIKANML